MARATINRPVRRKTRRHHAHPAALGGRYGAAFPPGRRLPGIDRIRGPNYNAAMTDKAILEPAEYARVAVDVASEKQASDVVMLDIRGVCNFADYFVILTAESSRQMESLAEEIETALRRSGATLHHREGTHHTPWTLLDFGDVIVHLFGPDAREFYQIEGVWSQGVEVVRLL